MVIHSGNNHLAFVTIEKNGTEVINLTLCDDNDVPRRGDGATTRQSAAQPHNTDRLKKLIHKAKTDLGGSTVHSQHTAENRQSSRSIQNFIPSTSSSLPRVSPKKDRSWKVTASSSRGVKYPPSLLGSTASSTTGGHRVRAEYLSVTKEVKSPYFLPGERNTVPPSNTRSALSTPYSARSPLNTPRNTRNSLSSYGRNLRMPTNASAVATSLSSSLPVVIDSHAPPLLPTPSSTSSLINTSSRPSPSPSSSSVMFDDTSLGLGCGNSTFSDTRTKPHPSSAPTLSKEDLVYDAPKVFKRSRKGSGDEVGTCSTSDGDIREGGGGERMKVSL